MSEAKDIVERASVAGIVIAIAESCTGGMISGAITDIAGSSRVLDRGFVTYSNAAKMNMLGVSAETLDTYGAVSEQVAAEMAAGALQHSNATLTVSVTGIAGPGGSDFKPEGRVCFGIATKQRVETHQVDFGPLGRAGVRNATVAHALELLLQKLPHGPNAYFLAPPQLKLPNF